jgi:hypothetical protein
MLEALLQVTRNRPRQQTIRSGEQFAPLVGPHILETWRTDPSEQNTCGIGVRLQAATTLPTYSDEIPTGIGFKQNSLVRKVDLTLGGKFAEQRVKVGRPCWRFLAQQRANLFHFYLLDLDHGLAFSGG